MTRAADPALASAPHAAVHDHKPGRGMRPWLLGAKLVAVALYVGGLAAVSFIWITSDYNSLAPNDPRREWLLDLVGGMMVWFVVPALLLTMILGVLLLLQRPRDFLTMRWMRVKLVVLLILIPAGHFWCRAQALKLRDTWASVEAQRAAARGLTYGLVAALAGSITILLVARTKPRFGQPHAR